MVNKYQKLLLKGLVRIDIYQSSILKEGKSQEEIDKTHDAYISQLHKTFKMFNAYFWREMGDGGIYIFPTPIDAVDACLRFLDNLVSINADKNILGCPIFTRIGIHETHDNLESVPDNKRPTYGHQSLDLLGKLEKYCPIGKIAISKKVYEKLGPIRRDIFRPALSDYLRKKGAFILRRRPIMPQEEPLFNGLSDEQKVCLPPIAFPTWDKIEPNNEINLKSLDKVLAQPLLVIIGETQSTPKSAVSAAATSDAIGIIEIMAALKANIDVIAGLDQWEDTADLASERNIILVGSGVVNIYAFAFNDLIRPVHFSKNNGKVFDQIIATSNRGEENFGSHALPPKDCGLIAVSRNPLNLDKTLLWIAGITGIGTQSAARFVLDLISDPKAALREVTAESFANPIACIVGPKISGGPWEVIDYYRRWRIKDYQIIWMVDRDDKLIYFKKVI